MAELSIQQNSDIGALVRKTEQEFVSGTTHRSKYVDTSLYNDINTIDAYLNSVHISGKYDSLGREKPFYNIVKMARNVWYRATDIDRKNIIVSPTKIKDTLLSFFATIKLQKWMKAADFGTFLNRWGLVLAAYNSAVIKMVEADGKLSAMVVPWNRIYCDELDFDGNPKIEIIELTPGQLKQLQGYDQEMVEALIAAQQSRTDADGRQKDQKNNYIKLYEIHGNLPLSFLTGEEKDQNKYTQQMHVISFQEKKEKGEYDDFTLYKGKEKKDVYMLTWLIPSEDGSISLWGSVKNLFEAQWMANHTQKSVKDYLDLASKMIWQTSDGNLQGQNVLQSIETGDFIIHAPNQPLTLVSTNPQNTMVFENYGRQWEELGNKINGISESMLGSNPPSGTAWRQTEALLTEGHSLFDLMTENKGLAIEKMLREFIIPHLKKQFDDKDEIVADLDDYGVDRIDEMFINSQAIKRANEKIVQMVLDGETNDIDQQAILGQEKQGLQEMLGAMGGKRFYKPDDIDQKTWKEILKNFEWEVDFDITGENKDKQTAMATLNTVFQVIGRNPAVLQDENAKMLFNKILNLTGTISPLEIKEAQINNQQPSAPASIPDIREAQPQVVNQ